MKLLILIFLATASAYGPPRTNHQSGCANGCPGRPGFPTQSFSQVASASHQPSSHIQRPDDYWWNKGSNPFQSSPGQVSSHHGSRRPSSSGCVGHNCPSYQPSTIGGQSSRPQQGATVIQIDTPSRPSSNVGPSVSVASVVAEDLPSSIQNLVQPMGICPSSYLCVHWQLCRNGVVITDGTGIIDKQIKTIPNQVIATSESCGGDMICCSVPSVEISQISIPGQPGSPGIALPIEAIRERPQSTVSLPVSPPESPTQVIVIEETPSAPLSPPVRPVAPAPLPSVSVVSTDSHISSPARPASRPSSRPSSRPPTHGSSSVLSRPQKTKPSQTSFSSHTVSRPSTSGYRPQTVASGRPVSGSRPASRPSSSFSSQVGRPGAPGRPVGQPSGITIDTSYKTRPGGSASRPSSSFSSLASRPGSPGRPASQPSSLTIQTGQVSPPSRPAGRPSSSFTSQAGRPGSPGGSSLIIQSSSPGRPAGRPSTTFGSQASLPSGFVGTSPMQPMMGGMGMMGMIMQNNQGGTCSAGTYCVPLNQCNPYNGFIIQSQPMAVWPDAPTVPLLACFVPDGSVTDGVCCQREHPIVSASGAIVD